MKRPRDLDGKQRSDLGVPSKPSIPSKAKAMAAATSAPSTDTGLAALKPGGQLEHGGGQATPASKAPTAPAAPKSSNRFVRRGGNTKPSLLSAQSSHCDSLSVGSVAEYIERMNAVKSRIEEAKKLPTVSHDPSRCFELMSGRVANDERTLDYTVFDVMGMFYSVNFVVPTTKQQWTVFVPTSDIILDLLRLWGRKMYLIRMRRLSSWIITSTNVAFSGDTIKQAHFDQKRLHRLVLAELYAIANRAAAKIQHKFRALVAHRQRLKKAEKEGKVREGHERAVQRVKERAAQTQQALAAAQQALEAKNAEKQSKHKTQRHRRREDSPATAMASYLDSLSSSGKASGAVDGPSRGLALIIPPAGAGLPSTAAGTSMSTPSAPNNNGSAPNNKMATTINAANAILYGNVSAEEMSRSQLLEEEIQTLRSEMEAQRLLYFYGRGMKPFAGEEEEGGGGEEDHSASPNRTKSRRLSASSSALPGGAGTGPTPAVSGAGSSTTGGATPSSHVVKAQKEVKALKGEVEGLQKTIVELRLELLEQRRATIVQRQQSTEEVQQARISAEQVAAKAAESARRSTLEEIKSELKQKEAQTVKLLKRQGATEKQLLQEMRQEVDSKLKELTERLQKDSEAGKEQQESLRAAVQELREQAAKQARWKNPAPAGMMAMAAFHRPESPMEDLSERSDLSPKAALRKEPSMPPPSFGRRNRPFIHGTPGVRDEPVMFMSFGKRPVRSTKNVTLSRQPVRIEESSSETEEEDEDDDEEEDDLARSQLPNDESGRESGEGMGEGRSGVTADDDDEEARKHQARKMAKQAELVAAFNATAEASRPASPPKPRSWLDWFRGGVQENTIQKEHSQVIGPSSAPQKAQGSPSLRNQLFNRITNVADPLRKLSTARTGSRDGSQIDSFGMGASTMRKAKKKRKKANAEKERRNKCARVIQHFIRFRLERRKMALNTNVEIGQLRKMALLFILPNTTEREVVDRALITAVELLNVVLITKTIERLNALLDLYDYRNTEVPVSCQLLCSSLLAFGENKVVLEKGVQLLYRLIHLNSNLLYTAETACPLARVFVANLQFYCPADAASASEIDVLQGAGKDKEKEGEADVDWPVVRILLHNMVRIAKRFPASRAVLGGPTVCSYLRGGLQRFYQDQHESLALLLRLIIVLTKSCSSAQISLGEAQVCDCVLMSLVHNYRHAHLVSFHVRALHNLCAQNCEANQLALGRGMYPMLLVNLAVVCRHLPNQLAEILRAICAVFCNCEVNQQRFQAAGGVELLIDLATLHTTNVAVVTTCLHALSCLILCTPPALAGMTAVRRQMQSRIVQFIKTQEGTDRPGQIAMAARDALARIEASALHQRPVTPVASVWLPMDQRVEAHDGTGQSFSLRASINLDDESLMGLLSYSTDFAGRRSVQMETDTLDGMGDLRDGGFSYRGSEDTSYRGRRTRGRSMAEQESIDETRGDSSTTSATGPAKETGGFVDDPSPPQMLVGMAEHSFVPEGEQGSQATSSAAVTLPSSSSAPPGTDGSKRSMRAISFRPPTLMGAREIFTSFRFK